MNKWFKKMFIPSGEKTTVVAYKSWVVRWRSVNMLSDTWATPKEQSEIFPSKEDAEKFADALIDARKLLKDKYFETRVEENQSKMASFAE